MTSLVEGGDPIQGLGAPQADGLSPTVEPVPVSPADAASIPSAETLHQILLAKLRAVFASAYAYRLEMGWTDSEMEARAALEPGQLRKLMLAPDRLNLRHVGRVFYALDFEPEFRLVPRASAIDARSGETGEARLDPKDESAVPQADAQGDLS